MTAAEQSASRRVEVAVLLAEYDACLRRIELYDNRIWQSVATFLISSIAGIPLLSIRAGTSPYGSLYAAAAAAIIAYFIWCWRGILTRWSTLLSGESVRAQELEAVLGMKRETLMFGPDDVPDVREFRAVVPRGSWLPAVRRYLNRTVALLFVVWCAFSIVQVIVFLSQWLGGA